MKFEKVSDCQHYNLTNFKLICKYHDINNEGTFVVLEVDPTEVSIFSLMTNIYIGIRRQT